MKIILEGCDCTGKTTLAKQLCERYFYDKKISYLHFSYNDRKDYNFYNIMLEKNNFISDRHFLSEIIYQKIFSRKKVLFNFEIKKLIKKCKKENIKIIILTCEDNELINRSKLRKNEEKQVLNNLLLINNEFKKIAKKYNFKIFDTLKNNFEEIINYIEEK